MSALGFICSDEALVLWREDEERIKQPWLHKFGRVQTLKVLLADDGGNLPDGGKASHENAVAAHSRIFFLAEFDKTTEALEADNFFGQRRIIAQSEIQILNQL